jgi:hypothetical protein
MSQDKHEQAKKQNRYRNRSQNYDEHILIARLGLALHCRSPAKTRSILRRFDSRGTNTLRRTPKGIPVQTAR